MPYDHTGNRLNGIMLHRAGTASAFTGRTSGLVIPYVSLNQAVEAFGDNLLVVWQEIRRAPESNAYRRTDHDDRDGNLPVAPQGNVVYREYHVPGTRAPRPGFVRLVHDPHYRRLFLTPTHYDIWLVADGAARRHDADTAVAPNAPHAQNPFYLIDTGPQVEPLRD